MSNLKAKLSAQLNKIEEIDSQNVAQESRAQVPTVQEVEATVLTLNPPIPVDNQIVQIVPQFATTFNDAKERIQMLQKFVKEFMVPGVDFGLIPSCQKPSLLKPGAEKLCDIYGFSKLVSITNRIEDWEKPFFPMRLRLR